MKKNKFETKYLTQLDTIKFRLHWRREVKKQISPGSDVSSVSNKNQIK